MNLTELTQVDPQPDWTKTQELIWCPALQDDSCKSRDPEDEIRQPSDWSHCNLVGSAVLGSERLVHKPILDIDLPCVLLPSTTPGHFHLFIDKAIPRDRYLQLLEVLHDCGIIGQGNVQQLSHRDQTTIRKPGVKKPCT